MEPLSGIEPDTVANRVTVVLLHYQRDQGFSLITSEAKWSRLSDSNRRHAVYKTAALPTELRRHLNFKRVCWRGS